MGPDGPARIAIAGEHEAHRVLATRPVDEAILARTAGRNWPERNELSQVRAWEGSPGGESWFDTKRLTEAFREVFPGKFQRTNRIDGRPAGEAATCTGCSRAPVPTRSWPSVTPMVTMS